MALQYPFRADPRSLAIATIKIAATPSLSTHLFKHMRINPLLKFKASNQRPLWLVDQIAIQISIVKPPFQVQFSQLFSVFV